MKLKLKKLNLNDEAAFMKGLQEWEGEELSWYTFDWEPGISFESHIERLNKNAKGVDLKDGHVPSSMLYGFVEGEIIGRVSIRHELNKFLIERGGNIGYSVAPKFRKKGYAKEMFRQALEFCKGLNLKKVLITCEVENVASCKIIERFGGKLENEIYDSHHKAMIRRYWIQIK